jgi:hypothetical protein
MVRRDVVAPALWLAWGLAAGLACSRGACAANENEAGPCTRPDIGSEIPEPPDLRSSDGVLKVRLTLRNQRESDGSKLYEPFLRDTVNVPYYSPAMLRYPSVRLRMDFRDPNIVGTFVYHCHLLEHEDAGMMGTVRVDPRHDRIRPWRKRPALGRAKAWGG